jgi:hypothetical protein
MHGHHARPTSSRLFGTAPTAPTPAGPAPAGTAPPGTTPAARPGARHSRRTRLAGRLRRRILAYRAVDFLPSRIPDASGPGEECLLLVHIRRVVGRVHYRVCTPCAQGVITTVVIDEPFLSTGLGTRALSHLRSRHPGLAWRSTLRKRTTRDLLRRMRVPAAPAAAPCPHTRRTPPPPGTA